MSVILVIFALGWMRINWSADLERMQLLLDLLLVLTVLQENLQTTNQLSFVKTAVAMNISQIPVTIHIVPSVLLDGCRTLVVPSVNHAKQESTAQSLVKLVKFAALDYTDRAEEMLQNVSFVKQVSHQQKAVSNVKYVVLDNTVKLRVEIASFVMLVSIAVVTWSTSRNANRVKQVTTRATSDKRVVCPVYRENF